MFTSTQEKPTSLSGAYRRGSVEATALVRHNHCLHNHIRSGKGDRDEP
jgi:hypothetical protein